MSDDRDRSAWAEEDWNHFEDKPMKPQPDMAQMHFDEPPTWREYAADVVMLVAACMGGFGLLAIVVCVQEWLQ